MVGGVLIDWVIRTFLRGDFEVGKFSRINDDLSVKKVDKNHKNLLQGQGKSQKSHLEGFKIKSLDISRISFLNHELLTHLM